VIYPDTSFIISFYTPEWEFAQAREYMAAGAPSLIYTPFHRLEVRTGLRARVFRKSSTVSELQIAFRQMEEDIVEGILHHTPLNWSDALREAERLGEAHLTETGVRSGDLLHVASAVVLGAREFVTFDQRQTKLARRAGLKVKAWKLSK
jgi:predicted nucleic acid-binding protein